MKYRDVDYIVPEKYLLHWQEICDILAEIADIPAALIMRLTGNDIEVFVASKGTKNPYLTGAKEEFLDSGLYCEHVIKSDRKLKVPNALEDEAWKENPDVKLNMISYLGFPIKLPNKQPFGTICILDNKTNGYSENIERLMTHFRDLIESQLEIVYVNQKLGDENKSLIDYLEELQTLRGFVTICARCKDIQNTKGVWHSIEHYLINHPHADFSHSICPGCMEKLYPGIKVTEPK